MARDSFETAFSSQPGRDDIATSLALLDDADSARRQLPGQPTGPETGSNAGPVSQADSRQATRSTPEITQSPNANKHPGPISGANASVRFDINDQSFGISDGTGNERKSSGVELGILGISNSEPQLNSGALKRVSETGRFGADVQSTVISTEVKNELPLASRYLKNDAANDLVLLNERKSDSSSDKAETWSHHTYGAPALQTIKDHKQYMSVAKAGHESTDNTSELRFSANPDQYNILDVRRNLPPGFNADGSADYILSALSEKVSRDNSSAQYYDKHHNLVSHTEISGRSGHVATDISVSNQDEANKIRLLFFSINSCDHREFPTAVVDAANKLKFNADSMQALQLAEKEKDPLVRKATELAIVEQQLKQYGTSYFDIAWDEASKMFRNESSVDSLAASRSRVDAILTKMSNERNCESEPNADNNNSGNVKGIRQMDEGDQRPGLSTAEKATAARLYSSLFTREDYLRCVGRAYEQCGW